jgi:hypothetical protein
MMRAPSLLDPLKLKHVCFASDTLIIFEGTVQGFWARRDAQINHLVWEKELNRQSGKCRVGSEQDSTRSIHYVLLKIYYLMLFSVVQ